MKNPTLAARRTLRRTAFWLRFLVERLRRREGTLSFHAERQGPFAREAAALAAALGCILTDRLGPALDALERAASDREPLPDPDEAENGRAAQGGHRP